MREGSKTTSGEKPSRSSPRGKSGEKRREEKEEVKTRAPLRPAGEGVPTSLDASTVVGASVGRASEAFAVLESGGVGAAWVTTWTPRSGGGRGFEPRELETDNLPRPSAHRPVDASALP